MTQNEFANLCRTAGYELQLADPEALATRGQAVIEDVGICLVLDGKADRVLCRITLGTIRSERRSEIYEDMLAINAEIGDARQGSFSLDIETDTALLTVEIALRDLDGATALAGTLLHYAAFASGFREEVLKPAKEPDESGALVDRG